MRKKLRQLDFDKFKPSEYMRARRPELFSDSKLVEEPRLIREVFSHYLETLTSRLQEYDFECFCRRLSEKELCPNLHQQTGPTAGGDGKTDTETYPVADAISLRWYEGIGREAAEERWAFAISTQKTWKPKVRGDVKKIIQTGRGYSIVYFISNQFIPGRDRTTIEDELNKKYGIQIRILDRNWILKCVFENGRQQLAIETLKLTGYEKQNCRSLGPRDTERELELQKLEKDIQDCDRYKGVEYQLGEDCMQAAILARNLERTRVEVDGRFDRAERIAEQVGYRQQIMRIAYIRTWTAFYWYDDIGEFNKGYGCVEKLAVGSEQYEDIGKLANLWMLLATTVKLGQLDATQAQLEERKTTLKDELDRLAAEQERPNNALLAKIRRLLINLFESFSNDVQINHILDELHETIKTGQSYLDFPFELLSEIFQELDELFPENKKLDEIFETLVQLTEKRTSQGNTGCLLLQRGGQRLKNGNKYDAIKLFSRAQEKLGLDEYREAFVDSLVGCALAYESSGLLWAARRNMLVAANEALRDFWKHGNVVPGTLYYLQKLVWLELQLGRIPYILSWMDVASVVAQTLILDKPERDRFINDRQIQDLVLGLLLLKTELLDLKCLDFLPCVLESKGLIHSWMAILYALGHEEYLRHEKVIPISQNAEEVLDFFDKWLIHPASRDLPESPELLQDTEVTLSTFVIGCHLKVETANEFDSICLGETILSILEAFLATGLDESILPYQPELQIRIRPSEYITGMPEYRLEEADGVGRIEIRHVPKLARGVIDQCEAYREWLREIMTFVFCQIAVIDDPKTTFERMANEGAAFSRALSIVDTDVCIKNILGENPRFCLSDWKSQTKERIFPLQRSVSWSEGRVSTAEQTDSDVHPPKLKESKGLDWLSGIDNLKHRDIRVHSVINIPLWDRAKWNAMAYVWSPNELPSLVLGFTNSDAGKAIFKGWQARFGKVDEHEYIRVSVVTGIDERRPYRYSVVIGVNPEFLRSRTGGSHSFMVSKVLGMDPSTPKNLEQFLTQYKETNSYIILPGHYENPSLPPVLCTELGIEKRNLRVCEAWQIDEHDLDICALQPGINPIIPDGIKNAPVHRALKYITKMIKQRH